MANGKTTPSNLHEVWSYLINNGQTEAANLVASAESKIVSYERVLRNVDYELDRLKAIVFEGRERT